MTSNKLIKSVGSVAMMVLVVTSIVGGFMFIPGQAAGQTSDTDPCEISRSKYYDDNEMCNDEEVTQNDIADNTTKLALLQNLESNAQFNQEITTIYSNYLEDTGQAAFIEGRHAIGQAWESGDNQTQAQNQAHNAIGDYYAIKQINLLNSFSHVVLNGGYVNDETNEFNYTNTSDNPFVYMSTDSNTVNGNTMTYITRPIGNHSETNVTLQGQSYEITVPHVEVFNYQNEEVVYTGALLTNISDLDTDNNHISIDTKSYNTVNVSINSMTMSGFNTSEDDYSSRNMFDGYSWVEQYNRTVTQKNNVQNNFDTSLVNDTYTALDNGDVTPTQLLGMDGLVSELAGNSTVSSDRYKMAMYRILNIGSPDLNTTSSIQAQYTGFTDTQSVYNNETDTRAVYASNWTDNTTLNGMLFTRDVTLAKGDTVAVDPFTDGTFNDTYGAYGFNLDWRNSSPYVNVYKNGEIVETQEIINPNNYDGHDEFFTVKYNGEYNKLVVGQVGNISIFELNTSTDTLTKLTQIQEPGEGYHGSSDGYMTLGDSGGGGTIDKTMTTIRLQDNAYVSGTPAGVNATSDVGGTDDTAYVSADYGGLYEVNFSNNSYDELTGDVISKSNNLEIKIIDNQLFYYDQAHIAGITHMYVYNLSSVDYSQNPTLDNDVDDVYNVSFNDYVDVYALGDHVYYTNGSMYSDDGVKLSDGLSQNNPVSDTYEEGDDTEYDDVISQASFIDANADDGNNDKTLEMGVFEVGVMTDTNGTEIETVTNETLTYIENQTGVNRTQIVEDMDRFDSVEDIDGTDDIEAIQEYYDTDLSGAPLNEQSWEGTDYSTTNTSEFADEIEEIQESLNTIQTYDDGGGGGGISLPGLGGLPGLPSIGLVLGGIVVLFLLSRS